jgi:nucleotide-binding universal stress UspA family protein
MVTVVMVPLDGSEFGEQALPMAAHVATEMHAGIELVHVVEVPPPYLTQGAPPRDPRDRERELGGPGGDGDARPTQRRAGSRVTTRRVA